MKDGERFEAALRRFRKVVDNSGLMSELRKREYFEKPSVKRNRQNAAAKKRASQQNKGDS